MALLYKKVSSADSPVNLSSKGLDAVNSNQNSLVMDFDLSMGNITLNLPSITSLLFSQNNGNSGGMGAGAMTFYIKGAVL